MRAPAEAGCLTCGATTEIIHRYIGFFGLQEIRCKWCRDCVPDAAQAAGRDPEESLRQYDDLVAAVKDQIEDYRRRSGKNAPQDTGHTDQ